MAAKDGLEEVGSGSGTDSRTAPNRGSRGKLQMEEEALQRRWKCKRQTSREPGWKIGGREGKELKVKVGREDGWKMWRPEALCNIYCEFV